MILCGGATLNLDDYSLSKYTVTVFQIYYAIVFPDYNVWGIINPNKSGIPAATTAGFSL